MPLYIVNYSDEGECILHVGHFIVAEVQCIVVILSQFVKTGRPDWPECKWNALVL